MIISKMNKEEKKFLRENERFDDLQYKGLKIIQNKNLYSFTSDAVLLANYVKLNKNEFLVDLCSGCGVVGILAGAKNDLNKVVGIEIQKNLCDMSKRTVEFNDLSKKVSMINAPIQFATDFLEIESVDAICVNPPYRMVHSSVVGEDESLNGCKFEMWLKFEDIAKVANKLLKFGGKFFMVADSTRLLEMCETLRKNNLQPKEIQFIYGTYQKNSNVFLIKAVKGGKDGVCVLPPKLNI